MASGGIDYSMFLESSIFCSKEYITDQHIKLPHDKDGKIDYSVLGNIIAAKLLEEKLYISYVDKAYGHSKDVTPDLEGWKYFTEEKAVKIFRKCYANFPLHAFAGRCLIDVPMQRVAKVISNLKNRFHYDPMLQEAQDTTTLSPEDYICYMRHEAKRCLFTAKRDFCFYERRAFKEGKYIQSAMSVDHHTCPLREGIIRAKFHPGTGWILEPYRGDPTRTLVTLICHMDLCGMPNLIINRVIRREPVGLAYLKRFIMSMDNPTIALPALSSMTLNFDASVSSSISYESRSLPATPTCVYVRSPDLLLNKSSKESSVTDSGELFVSALQAPIEYNFVSSPQAPKLTSQDDSTDLTEQNTSDNSQLNTNSNCNKVDQPTGHVQQQENGPQILTKSRKYTNNLALAADHSDSIDNSLTVSSTNSQNNVTFTLSARSDASGLGSDRGTMSNTVGHQASLEENKKSAVVGSESLEVPPLPNSNF